MARAFPSRNYAFIIQRRWRRGRELGSKRCQHLGALFFPTLGRVAQSKLIGKFKLNKYSMIVQWTRPQNFLDA